ncbi:MAG: hypothetical protein PHE53_02275 [Thermoguttaceae bacterium]|nr:hypothetical protein [Thermoguttaceae bacterium]
MRFALIFCATVFWMTAFGALPQAISEGTSSRPTHGVPGIQQQLDQLAQTAENATSTKAPTTITIPNGTYHFYFDQGIRQTHYISNHDQSNPKSIGIVMENLKNVTLDCQNSLFIFHGKMLPIVMKNCVDCSVKNLRVDFDHPAIAQVEILKNTDDGITIKIANEHQFELENNQLFFHGDGWRYTPGSGIAFDPRKRNLVYNTADLQVNLQNVQPVEERVFFCPNWKDAKLVPGTIVALRPWDRPAPAFFLYQNTNTTLESIKVHYAEGMGLLAQVCDGIHLNGFAVCLRESDQPGVEGSRYFTAQADATHFSGCKGLILSENGLYENMMDDAINVHGTYLKVVKRVDDQTLECRYMHDQSWGFHWGDSGDTVQFIRSKTMEILSESNVIASIEPVDQPTEFGVRVFRIRFEKPVPAEVVESGAFGVENLTWTPEVIFRKNIVRNNRARGALFSTPRKTIVEDNLFDHTSGTAILLCGDCNGWFETGACREVVIRRNQFINSLTSMFQFTNAIISIYPEIPDLGSQKQYFHGGNKDAILIEDNIFETFDKPLVYAKSLDGLTFRNNTVRTNHDFPAFHWNTHAFLFERVQNIQIEHNQFDWNFNPKEDILTK